MTKLFEQNHWHQGVSRIIRSINKPEIWSEVADLLQQLARFDDFAVFLFEKGHGPELLYYQGIQKNQRLVTDIYIEGLYVLDPFFLRATDREWGFKSIQDIAPRGFHQSDLYEIYYRQSDIIDDVGYIFEVDPGSFLFLSMSRTTGSGFFKDIECQHMKQVSSVIDAICCQFWALQERQDRKQGAPLHSKILQVLHAFGSSLLTDREVEVIHRILRGYSAQAIADDLSISINTVKLHRKNAYAKLDIASQNELFHMFLDSLSCVTEEEVVDPLIGYLSIPTNDKTQ